MAYEGYNSSQLTSNTRMQNYEAWKYVQYLQFKTADALMTQNSIIWDKLKKVASIHKGGKNLTCPILIGGVSNRSKDFATAQKLSEMDAGRLKVGTWVGNSDADFAVDSIPYEDWITSKNNMATFKDERKIQLDNTFRGIGVRKEQEVFGLGSNRVFKVKAINATNKTVTVDSPEQVLPIEINSYIQFYASDGTKREAGQANNAILGVKVNKASKVQRTHDLNSPPKITFADALPTDLAVNDYGYFVGDYGKRSIASIQEWIPTTDPTSTAYFGIDRTVEIERLSGFRKVLTSTESVHKSLATLTRESRAMSRLGLDSYWLHPMTENVLINSLEKASGVSIEHNQDGKSSASGRIANFGYGQVVFHTGKDAIPVMLSEYIPQGHIYGLNWQQMMFKYIPNPGTNGFLGFIRDDNGQITRLRDGSNNFESRIAMFAQLFMQCPGSCFVLDATEVVKSGLWS